jgi:predicted small lipoprotein YifL
MTRYFFYALTLVTLSLATTGCGKKVPLTAAPTVPAAAGTLDVGSDQNGNTTFDLRVKHLAKPENLTPPASAYVVWVQPRGEALQNQGQLTVNGDLSGEFKGTTPSKNFDVIVTAENNPQVSAPTGQEVMRQHASR